MKRGSSWTSSKEINLIEDASREEANGFLKPLQHINGIQHIGWKSFDPVFKLEENTNIQSIQSQLINFLEQRRLNSAGHKMYIVSDNCKPREYNTLLILKIEDWRKSCIPNTHHTDEKRRNKYIKERESEIRKRLINQIPNSSRILIDRHVSDTGYYGQYQFMAIKTK